MSRPSPVSDKSLLQSVQRKLQQKCPGSKIVATVRSGAATVTGTIKNEHERKPIIRTVSAVQGIKRVADQLRVQARVRIVHQVRTEPKPIIEAESIAKAEPDAEPPTASEDQSDSSGQ